MTGREDRRREKEEEMEAAEGLDEKEDHLAPVRVRQTENVGVKTSRKLTA